MNELFFELIQISIGNRACLSHTPTAEEWKPLYEMAKKQSLVGVCFAGVQRLQQQRQESPEMLYLTWMGMAAKIQQRNEEVNRQCVEVQRMIEKAGFRNFIMKGQGNAALYNEDLKSLRQSGDIDIYVEGGFDRVMQYVNSVTHCHDFTFQHVHFLVLNDTEVEVHYSPIALMGWMRNRRLQNWFDSKYDDCFRNKLKLWNSGFEICAPTTEFNLIYQMAHIYRHVFVEGIGLRQLMDYYFLLKSQEEAYTQVSSLLKDFGMLRFAKGLMWVIEYVFVGSNQTELSSKVGIEPDEKEGRFLLNEIMETGNFSHGKLQSISTFKPLQLVQIMGAKLHLLGHYPSEVIATPFYLIRHFVWKHLLKRKWLH